jgi:hypothetical protein
MQCYEASISEASRSGKPPLRLHGIGNPLKPDKTLY